MNEEIKKLKKLQELYLEKKELLEQAQQYNSEYKHRLEIISKTEKLIDSIGTQLKDIEKQKARSELEVKTLADKIKSSEEKILKVKNANELQALQNQIENLNVKKREEEDKLMKIYTMEEELGNKNTDVKQKYEKYKKITERFKIKRDDFMKEAEKRIDEIDKEIQKIRTEIEEETLNYFDRVFKNANDVVIAKVEHQRCSYCNQMIPLQDYIDLKAGKGIIRCAYCDRILYVDEEAKQNS